MAGARRLDVIQEEFYLLFFLMGLVDWKCFMQRKCNGPRINRVASYPVLELTSSPLKIALAC